MPISNWGKTKYLIFLCINLKSVHTAPCPCMLLGSTLVLQKPVYLYVFTFGVKSDSLIWKFMGNCSLKTWCSGVLRKCKENLKVLSGLSQILKKKKVVLKINQFCLHVKFCQTILVSLLNVVECWPQFLVLLFKAPKKYLFKTITTVFFNTKLTYKTWPK